MFVGINNLITPINGLMNGVYKWKGHGFCHVCAFFGGICC